MSTRNIIPNCFFSVVCLCLAIGAILPVPASGDETFTVYCYQGTPRDNRLMIGSVVVGDTGTAAQACNNIYYDCRKNCVGCFHDFDYVEDVCVDSYGNVFLR